VATGNDMAYKPPLGSGIPAQPPRLLPGRSARYWAAVWAGTMFMFSLGGVVMLIASAVGRGQTSQAILTIALGIGLTAGAIGLWAAAKFVGAEGRERMVDTQQFRVPISNGGNSTRQRAKCCGGPANGWLWATQMKPLGIAVAT
jgi:hypothetical protein